ncbi:HisA/HisF-related TIM barrel protein [Stieleria sp. TO1_6]|uniref:HisA/HisF-related TIM barrel protein n=1 Tax=Stieleria tagensis TaxID=2956795 RepID=UPI00209BA1B4|nr:HisA/HisF-related TIM barrel protein [Stieleria tagensis]MCO8120463.1 HisA/HisF-related TIM barrel protein [Stieleria tagensis]
MDAPFRSDWIQPELLRRLVGVVDLRCGQAVHAVGGHRDRYQPLAQFFPPGHPVIAIAGDACRLAQSYRAVGLSSFYVADLDGILSARWQQALVLEICGLMRSATRLYLDLGLSTDHWRSNRSQWVELLNQFPNLQLVMATESANSTALLDTVLDDVPVKRVTVSFDFQKQRWLSNSTTIEQWIAACRQTGIRSIIGLDLIAVGNATIQPTLALCHQLRRSLPAVRYITGGGIRSVDDVHRLAAAGADELLVASLFNRPL